MHLILVSCYVPHLCRHEAFLFWVNDNITWANLALLDFSNGHNKQDCSWSVARNDCNVTLIRMEGVGMLDAVTEAAAVGVRGRTVRLSACPPACRN